MDGEETLTDPLEVLTSEIRVRILRELAEADRPLPFTELRERVGVRDSGKFNYHLDRLCSYFVRRDQAGYELHHAGSRIVAAADGEFDADAAADAATADGCPVCGDEDCEKLYHVHLDGRLG
ncbi:ArsR family transcriptional regulator [Halovivax sp.]|uniref:DUF7347 domain-containing protein n=1 Tax=Halovivax sp. TaxID=1935978 RepID=UPI0025BE42F1|nr:ArsR family transcriptional regulator [Halovivax sp.]